VRANEIYIAYILSIHFLPEAVNEVGMLYAEKAEKFFEAKVCLSLL
jgi:hypothetical protein